MWSRFLPLAAILAATAALAQQPPQQSPTPTPDPPPQVVPQTPPPPPEPAVLSQPAAAAYERRESFPYFNLYVPEGQFSIRARKLIKNVLLEFQIDYRFANGDISSFLRYKYYARSFTYKISVFDTIGFPELGRGNPQDFQRVRGGLLLTEFPRDYNHRYFWLVQDDRLTFGDITNVDNRKNNIYTKLGFQYGTQFDEHLNAIVGESRGRIVPVLTAFREIGPQKLSIAAALTESAKLSTGAYRYTKLETEALRRWDVTPTSFIVTRAHLGEFLTKSTIRGPEFPQLQRYSIPLYELFTLGGREALKSIGVKDAAAGTSELHVTNEYFVPIFRNRDYRTLVAHWNTLYGIGYFGAGNVGFSASNVVRVRNYAVDAGLGAEASLTVRDLEILLGIVFAHTIRAPDELKGNKVLISLRTVR